MNKEAIMGKELNLIMINDNLINILSLQKSDIKIIVLSQLCDIF